MNGFGPQILNFAQTTGEEPFLCGGVGGLGIHVDQPVTFFYGNQVVFGFSVGICAFLALNRRTFRQQLPAAAGVFDMADFYCAVYFNMSNKPVGAG